MNTRRNVLSIALLTLTFAALVVGVGGARKAAAGPDDTADNAGWVEIGPGSASGGGISNSTGNSSNPSLAIGLDGAPIVAWADVSSGNVQIYVRRWNGSAWVEMGGGSASGGGISNDAGSSYSPSLAVSPGGAPIVAWYDISGSPGHLEIYVRRWIGSGWKEMGSEASGGGISNSTGNSSNPSLAIDHDGAPIVAWDYNSESNQDIYVRRWNGAAWVEMGSGSASGGGISNSVGTALSPSLAIGPDGAPIVAWSNFSSSGNQEIYMRRWNGLGWKEMGSEASGGGISNNAGNSSWPSLAIGPDGTLIVAWQDDSSGNQEIYARRWNGSAWVEMGAGSASGGGISNNAGNSSWSWPSLAIGADGAPVVAWKDGSSGNDEIYVRRYQPPCHTLTRTHTGQGSNPIASPANSPGCPAGEYTKSQSIFLTATPTTGWRVAGWGGTNNDGSTAGTNMLTMPEADHTVSVTYQQNSIAVYLAFAPSVLHQLLPCFSGPEEMEPNNNSSQANGPLCTGRSYTGLPNDRFDIFYFDTRSQGRIVLEMQNHVGNGVQLQLHYQAISSNPIFDADGTDGYRVEYKNAPAGRYYIVVSTASPAPSSTIRYALKATFSGE